MSFDKAIVGLEEALSRTEDYDGQERCDLCDNVQPVNEMYHKYKDNNELLICTTCYLSINDFI